MLNIDTMAREGWEHEKIEEKPEKTREGGKTVRFVSSETCDKNERTPVEQIPQNPQNPVSMVQSLVPHLPGLDKDTIYVISGKTSSRSSFRTLHQFCTYATTFHLTHVLHSRTNTNNLGWKHKLIPWDRVTSNQN